MARRRRRVTARVSIRPSDKRLLDPDDPRSLVARLHATLWLFLGRPVETKFWRVLRDLETQPLPSARHREESRNTSSPASARRHTGSYREVRNT